MAVPIPNGTAIECRTECHHERAGDQRQNPEVFFNGIPANAEKRSEICFQKGGNPFTHKEEKDKRNKEDG